MSEINNYLNKIKNTASLKSLIHILINSFNYRRKIFVVKDVKIRELLLLLKAYKKLKKKYSKVLHNTEYCKKESRKSDTVWFCWFQGVENAPLLVQKCYERAEKTFGKSRITVITSDNFKDYVDLPEFIIQKWHKGIISHAHFSDILRTWLLAEYGGIWLDSTVFILDSNLPDYLTESELFLFNNCRTNSIINISSWYICSYSHNIIFESVKSLLTEYWRKENYSAHYFIFHLFFKIATEYYPEEWKKVPKFSNAPPHMLISEIFEKYTEKREKELALMSPIHKLTYKLKIPPATDGTFYEKYILK